MDDQTSPRPVAGWYLPAAVAAMLFMAFGCVMYLMRVLADPSGMTIEQRTLYDAVPIWVTVAQAIAVWIGLAGTVLLVMRKRHAEVLLAVSLVAVLVWLAGLLLDAGIRENMSANDLLVAIAVTAITWTIFWFARHSRQRGWLR